MRWIKEASTSFFKKRYKKPFSLMPRGDKSFLVLFFKKGLLSSFLLGCLTALALPPFTLTFLVFVTIPGLLALIGRASSWRGAALRGLLFGLGLNLIGLYWVTNAVLVMAAQFWWAVPISVPLLSAVLAVFIAVPCGLARLVSPGWGRVLALSGLWVLGDLARQFVLSGFPWNLLGSVWEFPGDVGLAFIQPAAWVGVHGLTLATLLIAGAMGLGPRVQAGAFAALAAWGAAGAWRLSVPAPETSLTAVIVQGNISEQDHRDHGTERAWAESVFDRYLALTRAGVREAGTGANVVVVWPETASPFALAQDPGGRRAVADAAAPALMTLAGTERFEPGNIAHNSLVAVAPDGSLAGFYDKAHLVPFGEYFPSYAHIILGEQGFVPGPGLRTLHLPPLPAIGALICYEAIFPSQVVAAGDRPQLLVNITNDAWFGDSAGPRQHLAAARMRTVEEGLPMLRAANTGISAIIDAQGRITKRLEIGRSGVLVAKIPGAMAQTIAGRFGLYGPGLLACLCVGFGVGIRSNATVVLKKLENDSEKRKLG